MRGANGGPSPTGERSTPSVIRFGVYELAPDNEELRKNGVRIRLGGQPYQILLRLLENPGKLVSRKELRSELWPDDTFVDFDHCLNTAVNRVRDALGDSAENPRFVQTVTRRGYRFVAPVERIEEPAEPAVAEPVEAEQGGQSQEEPGQRRWATRLIPFVVAAAVVAATAWRFWRADPAPVSPGSIVSLTDLPGSETTPSLSPNGAMLAFSWNGGGDGNQDIYLKPVDSDLSRRLTTDPGDEFGPAYSPDGETIAFYRCAGDSATIYMITPSNNRETRVRGLTFGPSDESPQRPGGRLPALLSWSPNGESLAYVDKSSPSSPFSIFIRSLDTREDRQFTWPPEASYGDSSPVFSPDGKLLAFVRETTESSGDIYLASQTGGDPQRLTNDNCPVQGLTWTPDGHHIVFSSERSGQPSLWRIPVSGGGPERVAGVPENAIFPTISTEPRRLAFVRTAREMAMWRAPLGAGSSATSGEILVPDFAAEATRYSPDGRSIVFTMVTDGKGSVWRCDSDGENVIRLASMPGQTGSPRWSPDGGSIAFDALVDGSWEVYTIDADGGDPRRLTKEGSSNVRPSWSRDGQWIIFGSDRSGTTELWRISVNGGEVSAVTKGGGYEGDFSRDGRFIYYTRRSMPGLWRVPAEGGEEKLVLEELQWESIRNWQVVEDGIYFLSWEGRARRREWFVNFYRFETGEVELAGTLGDARPISLGISVSPDRRWLIYTRPDETQTDVVMIDGFR